MIDKIALTQRHKATIISRQDAAPTEVNKMWEWLPATIDRADLLF
ncbi:MAG: hypothetical protein PVF60_12395 [Desulfobacterales bacterium]|jgi:hypothetical protein